MRGYRVQDEARRVRKRIRRRRPLKALTHLMNTWQLASGEQQLFFFKK